MVDTRLVDLGPLVRVLFSPPDSYPGQLGEPGFRLTVEIGCLTHPEGCDSSPGGLSRFGVDIGADEFIHVIAALANIEVTIHDQ